MPVYLQAECRERIVRPMPSGHESGSASRSGPVQTLQGQERHDGRQVVSPTVQNFPAGDAS